MEEGGKKGGGLKGRREIRGRVRKKEGNKGES